jgi:hypothetical protein
MAGRPAALEALRARLDEILAERHRQFPRRDPRNTEAMQAAFRDYVAALRAWNVPARPRGVDVAAGARVWTDHPVFVGGFMKSGTSLLVGLLDGHPELVVLPGDSHALTVLRRLGGLPPPDRLRDLEYRWVQGLVNPHGQAPYWLLGDDDGPYRDFLAHLDAWMSELPHDARGAFTAALLAFHSANPRRAARPRAWIEKTPGNEARVGALLELFPAARFIHIVRNPLPTIASLKRLFAYRGWRWRVAGVAWRLRSSMAAGLRHQERLGPGRYHVLRYEDLVAAPEREMSKVAAFLAIEPHACLFQPTVNGHPMASNSMYADRRIRGEVLSEPSEQWRSELSFRERFAVVTIMTGVARAYGYPTERR